MRISERLEKTAEMVPDCDSVVDIGTDHAYIPIYLMENKRIKSAIASDIKAGPIEVAKKNIARYGYKDSIITRVGPGFSTISTGEVDVAVIAGMGGNMIVDIIEENFETARSMKNMIIQPVQYPEMVREFILKKGFSIIDEDIVKDENKFYFIIKIENKKSEVFDKEVFFYTGKKLIEKKHPILKDYISFKIHQLTAIKSGLNTETQELKYNEISNLLKQFKEVEKLFKHSIRYI